MIPIMNCRRRTTTVLALAGLCAAWLGSAVVPAHAQGVKAGVLECGISGGVGFVITSSKALGCTFKPSRGRPEHYVGTVRRFGLDIGITGPGRLAWIVFAPSSGIAPGALAGDYVGASGEASAGVGVGANALVGGFNRSFSLQPLSAQVQSGVDLALGVGAMTLEPAEAAPPPRATRRRH